MSVAADPMKAFGPVRSLDVRSLAGPVVDVQVPAGAHLVREGQVIGTFFVIRSGAAELWHSNRKVSSLGVGDCFGEIDSSPGRPQEYGVVASTPMRLLTFSAFGIARLCAAIPTARERLMEFLPQVTERELHVSERQLAIPVA
jgi:CRP-like cAMP-binding protein